MPMITIEYDDAVVSENEVRQLAIASQRIVSDITKIEDVFVYANTSKIKINVAPIEIFINMSASKISNPEELVSQIKVGLANWKSTDGFEQPINLTLIPMQWNIEIGI
jgi:hypothetical protein